MKLILLILVIAVLYLFIGSCSSSQDNFDAGGTLSDVPGSGTLSDVHKNAKTECEYQCFESCVADPECGWICFEPSFCGEGKIYDKKQFKCIEMDPNCKPCDYQGRCPNRNVSMAAIDSQQSYCEKNCEVPCVGDDRGNWYCPKPHLIPGPTLCRPGYQEDKNGKCVPN